MFHPQSTLPYVQSSNLSNLSLRFLLITSSISQLTSSRQRSACDSRRSAVLSTRTQPTLSKTLPDQALVDSTRERSIRINDSVTRLDKVGVTRLTVKTISMFLKITVPDANLQSHSVDNELHSQVLAIRRRALGVQCRSRSIILAVRVDQVPHDLVQHSCPGRSDGMDCVLRVHARVGERVGCQTGGVAVRANARASVHP